MKKNINNIKKSGIKELYEQVCKDFTGCEITLSGDEIKIRKLDAENKETLIADTSKIDTAINGTGFIKKVIEV